MRRSASGQGHLATERHRMLSVTSLLPPQGPACCRASLTPVVHPLTSIVGDIAYLAQPVRQTSALSIFVTLRKYRLLVRAGSAEPAVRRVALRHPDADGDCEPGRVGTGEIGGGRRRASPSPATPSPQSQPGRCPLLSGHSVAARSHGVRHSARLIASTDWVTPTRGPACRTTAPAKEAGARPWRGRAPVRSWGTTILLAAGHALESQHVPDGLLLYLWHRRLRSPW